MPLPIITDVVRAAVEGRDANGHVFANIMHFRKTTALTYVGAIAILDPLLLATYNAAPSGGSRWVDNAPTSATLTQFRYTPLDGISASTIIAHAISGAQTSDALPAGLALVVSLHTAKRGKSYRGRVYTGPYCELVNGANGAPTSALVAGMAVQWSDFLTRLSGSGLSLVVASYLHGTAENVTSVSVDGRWDEQRRRMGR